MVKTVTSTSDTCAWSGNEWLHLSNAQSNQIARDSLKIAIMQLMSDKALEDISVTELVKKAGVSRSAFYRNYNSKEALIEDICRQILDEILDLLRAPLHRENRPAWFAEIFRAIKKNDRYFGVYLETHMQLTKSSILELVCSSNGIKDHYMLMAREGAFMAVLTDWFRSGMNESPEGMGILCDEIIPHGKKVQP